MLTSVPQATSEIFGVFRAMMPFFDPQGIPAGTGCHADWYATIYLGNRGGYASVCQPFSALAMKGGIGLTGGKTTLEPASVNAVIMSP